MKKNTSRFIKSFITVIATVAIIPCYAAPNQIKTVTIVNHYPGNLIFSTTVNKETLLDLKSGHFVIREHSSPITTRIKENGDEAYLSVMDKNGKGTPINAFWGVDSTQIHGYIGAGLAFNWTQAEHAKIVFCAPQDYPCKM